MSPFFICRITDSLGFTVLLSSSSTSKFHTTVATIDVTSATEMFLPRHALGQVLNATNT